MVSSIHHIYRKWNSVSYKATQPKSRRCLKMTLRAIKLDYFPSHLMDSSLFIFFSVSFSIKWQQGLYIRHNCSFHIDFKSKTELCRVSKAYILLLNHLPPPLQKKKRRNTDCIYREVYNHALQQREEPKFLTLILFLIIGFNAAEKGRLPESH